jgi:endonuclease YncB( thermonuclease family)
MRSRLGRVLINRGWCAGCSMSAFPQQHALQRHNRISAPWSRKTFLSLNRLPDRSPSAYAWNGVSRLTTPRDTWGTNRTVILIFGYRHMARQAGSVFMLFIALSFQAWMTSPVWAAECIDGDTLTVDGTKFRLDGIDAPEFNQICLNEKGQSWKCGLAVHDALAKLSANCTTVQCDDKGPDTAYHRRIGLCTAKGIDITLNEWLVREGWALNFEPYAKGRFLAAQKDAAKNRRGIWKGCFVEPTNWRHWRTDAPLMGSTCPSDAAKRIFDCLIKVSRSGKYHHPGCLSYDSTTHVVKWFCSEDEARAEGYPKAGNCR